MITLLYSFGNNRLGRLGLGKTKTLSVYIPSECPYLQNQMVTKIESSLSHTLFLNECGNIFSCGTNANKQLGHQRPHYVPGRVDDIGTHVMTQIKCGLNHSLALSDKGQVLCWGNITDKSLEEAIQTVCKPRLVAFPKNKNIAKIASGFNHVLALGEDDEVFTWGTGDHGKLGLGPKIEDHSTPQIIISLSNLKVSHIAAGGNFSFVLTSGGLYGWGSNAFGQLGTGDTVDRFSPALCSDIDFQTVADISCGDNHTVILNHRGEVFTFGKGDYGQLGHGNNHSVTEPKLVERLKGHVVSMVACGSNHTVVYVLSSNMVCTFGKSGDGQLGRCFVPATNIPFIVPITPSLEGASMKSIHAGGNQTFILFSAPSPQLDQRVKEMVSELIENLTANGIVTEERIIQMFFSSLLNISGSMYSNSNYSEQHYMPYNHGINLSACEQVFKEIYACKPALKLFDWFVWDLVDLPNKLVSFEGLKLYVMLPLTHFFSKPEMSMAILDQLLKKILEIDDDLMKVLVNWWMGAGLDYINHLIKSLKRIQCILFDRSRRNNDQFRSSKYICIQILKIINDACKSDHSFDMELFKFQNLNELVNLESECLAKFCPAWWHEINISNFPFILDCQSKAILFRAFVKITMMVAAGIPADWGSLNHSLSDPYWDLELPCIVLELSRDRLYEDTIDQLCVRTTIDHKKPLRIIFRGEEGIDASALTRECITLLMEELIDPKHGVFRICASNFWFCSYESPDPIKFEMAGVVLGLALYHDVGIPNRFPLVLYKILLNKPVTLEDFEEICPEAVLHHQGILDGRVTCEEHCQAYFLEREGIYLTEEWRQHSVKEFLECNSISGEIQHFKSGFLSICGSEILRLFEPKELRKMTVAIEHFDWNKFEKATEYIGCNSENSTIKALWEVFREMANEDKENFLMFVTGTKNITAIGIKNFHIKIYLGELSGKLPQATACVKTLHLPNYGNKELLEEKLLIAIRECQSFDNA